MAVAPRPTPFEILDLRTFAARSLAGLFAEEEQSWQEELHWDYRPSTDMIRRHIDARTLPGSVALHHGQVAGYCFFLYEEDKGLIGDLFVAKEYRKLHPCGDTDDIATLLLEHTLRTLEHSPPVRRIEAQLLPFGVEPLEPVFRAHQFACFPRLFLFKRLTPARPPLPRRRSRGSESNPPIHAATGAALRRWEDHCFEAMAELLVDAYVNHVDSRINDHYQGVPGALRFLKNIVLFPGCGIFQREASLIATGSGADTPLLGAILCSQVARGVAHITQVCVQRQLQGTGLGRALLEAALERLAAGGYHGVSLTVTASNQGAVHLYQRLGFETIKEFSAYARNLR